MENCCKEKGISKGIISGLIPHIGCIAFIIFTILGVTTATSMLKGILMNQYLFYILIIVSLIFTTLSAGLYLRKQSSLSLKGIKSKWKYLSVLYTTTITINLFLFFIVFPYTTNAMATENAGITDSTITLKVDIPCSGHAPLITSELNKITGIQNIKFTNQNLFTINYDSTKTSKEQILNQDIFKDFKAQIP